MAHSGEISPCLVTLLVTDFKLRTFSSPTATKKEKNAEEVQHQLVGREDSFEMKFRDAQFKRSFRLSRKENSMLSVLSSCCWCYLELFTGIIDHNTTMN